MSRRFFTQDPVVRKRRRNAMLSWSADSLESRQLLTLVLDSSFSTDGKVTTDAGLVLSPSSVNGVAVQNDGKIVAIGQSRNAQNNETPVLVRYTSGGVLDPTFGDSGVAKPTVGNLDFYANDVAIQSDGKILAAGYSGGNTASQWNFTVVRYTENGMLDDTFGTDGIAVTSISTLRDGASSIVVQTDGKIVVAGYADVGTISVPRYNFAVVRYSSDGTLDGSFGANGIVTTSFGGTSTAEANDIALQNDGKLVVVGSTRASLSSGSDDFAVARYLANGSLDTTFSSDGKVTTDFSASYDSAYSVALQGDGKLVVAGSSDGFAIARYTPSGSLDTSFSNDGKSRTSLGVFQSQANGVAIQTDGKIVAAGFSFPTPGYPDFAIIRYNTDGSIETTLEENIIPVGPPINGSFDEATAIAIQSDGNIIVAGSSLGFNNPEVAVIRLLGPAPNQAPVITSNGGGATAAISVVENSTTVTTVTATDGNLPAQTLTYSIAGGADSTKFSINPTTGVLSFIVAPDFEVKSDFGANGVYNVQVRVTDDGSPGLSDLQSISVTVTDVLEGLQLLMPVLTGPATPTQLLQPTFTWQAVPTAASYEILLVKLIAGGTSSLAAPTVTATSFTPSTALGIGQFSYQVRAVDSTGVIKSKWSLPYSFQVTTPVTVNPPAAIQTIVRPTISWQVLPGAVSYNLQLENISTGTPTFVARPVGLTTTSWTHTADLPMGRYRIQVRGVDAKGVARDWSVPREFTVAPAPVPTAVASTFDRTPTFQWSRVAGATSYEIVVTKSGATAPTIQQIRTVLNFTPTIAMTDGQYLWKVRAIRTIGAVQYASAFSANSAIYIGGRPVGNPVTVSAGIPTFNWQAVQGAATYQIRIDRINPANGTTIQANVISKTGLTGTSHTHTGPLAAGTYRFWVKAVSTTGEVSVLSLPVTFTVTAVESPADSDPASFTDSLVVLTSGLTRGPSGEGTSPANTTNLPHEDAGPNEVVIADSEGKGQSRTQWPTAQNSVSLPHEPIADGFDELEERLIDLVLAELS